MSILNGLEQLGLGKLENVNVYESEEEKKAEAEKKEEKKEFAEESVLLDKSMKCPVCDQDFKTKTVRSGRSKMTSQDTDLRPKYQPLDVLKYDAVVCPFCGYAALNRFFKFVMPAQQKMIQDNISANFTGIDTTAAFYSYDEAITRHQLALANTIVKKAKASEKAYTCLKLAWLCRGKAESLDQSAADYASQKEELQKEENELLANAYDGFVNAYSNEDFPMCGMDELTVTYLLAELARRTGKLEEASRYVSKVLTSRQASERIKERARDVKDLINAAKA